MSPPPGSGLTASPPVEDLLFSRVEGRGAPVLLLNGVAMTAASWTPVANELVSSFQVMRCDLRGQLLSPGPPPPLLTGHAEDVARLLHHLAVPPVHLLATSFGGAVAMILAATRPELVRSLVVVATTDRFDEAMARGINDWRQACVETLAGGDRGRLIDVLDETVYSAAYLQQHPDERRQRRAQVASLPDAWFQGLIGLLDSAGTIDIKPYLARITCPTLVLAAGEDGFIPRQRMQRLAAAINGAQYEVMEGAGHAVVVEQPLPLTRHAQRFWSSLPAR